MSLQKPASGFKLGMLSHHNSYIIESCCRVTPCSDSRPSYRKREDVIIHMANETLDALIALHYVIQFPRHLYFDHLIEYLASSQ